jgi:hypothetical protein
LTFFFTSCVLLILPVCLWPCWCFFQAVFPDQFVFGRNRSSVAHSSWWSSSLDSWSCGNLDFYQQHNCSRYICFSWWKGISMKSMIITCIFFFDKSICYIKKRKRGATLSTLGVYKRDQGEKENNVRKSTKLIARGASQPVVQEKRVTRKKWRSSSRVLDEPSKHLSFISLQMHHNIQ